MAAINPTSEPQAWIGYAPRPGGGFAARVCAWCPDKAAAEKLARDAGLAVTHGCCIICYNKQLAELLGEKD